ncbi:hypothetical protein NL676_009242 [Syzygium grande]|nr:hypothetical protein NL676_009242 [Syzygium grande]
MIATIPDDQTIQFEVVIKATATTNERDRDGFSPTPPAPPPSHQEEAIAIAAVDSRVAPAPLAPALLSGRRSLTPPTSGDRFSLDQSELLPRRHRKPDPRFTPFEQ